MTVQAFARPNPPCPILFAPLLGELKLPVGSLQHDDKGFVRKYYLRRSVESDIVQPNIDHVEEPVVECSRPARLNLEQSSLSQELLQYRPRRRSIGNRRRVVRVEVSGMRLNTLNRFVIPPPKVILRSNDRVSLKLPVHSVFTNPEDIPPRRGLGFRYS